MFIGRNKKTVFMFGAVEQFRVDFRRIKRVRGSVFNVTKAECQIKRCLFKTLRQ